MSDHEFSMSGPEEGDEVDDTVLVINGYGDELLKINVGTLHKRKTLGRKIAALLTEAEADFL